MLCSLQVYRPQAQLDQANQERESLAGERDHLTKERNAVEAERAALRESREALSSQLSASAAEYSGELKSVKRQLVAAQEANKSLTNRLKNVSAQKKSDIIDRLETELEQADDRLFAMEGVHYELVRRAEEADRAKEALKKRFEKLGLTSKSTKKDVDVIALKEEGATLKTVRRLPCVPLSSC